MDEGEGMNSDESTPSRKSSDDGRRDSRGHFVMQLAGILRRDIIEEGNTKTNSISSSYEYDCSCRNMPMFSSDALYCYSLLEAMPIPGPVWSTTEPCVLAEPLESAPAEAPTGTGEASVEFEWGENQASSYSWWIGFLESLDGNMSSEKVKCPFVEVINVMEDSKGFGYDSTFVDATDQSCHLDDWLMIPTMEMDLEDMVVP